VLTAFELASSITREVRPFLYALCGSALCLFALACFNLCCLFLTRLNARRHEIALRAALGAESRRIIQHLCGEIAIVTAGGLALAHLISVFSIPALRSVHSSLSLQPIEMFWKPGFTCLLFCAAFGLFIVAALVHTK